MSAKDMHEAARCQHVRLSGRQCKAPAKRGSNWCVFHEIEHANDVNLTFPRVEDAASVAVATDQILQALRDDTIDFRRAALLFSGLRIARANLKLLNLELGEELSASEGVRGKKKEEEDDDHSELADYLMEEVNKWNEEMARETGVASPPPFDMEKAKRANVDEQMKMILDHLEIEEPGVGDNEAP